MRGFKAAIARTERGCDADLASFDLGGLAALRTHRSGNNGGDRHRSGCRIDLKARVQFFDFAASGHSKTLLSLSGVEVEATLPSKHQRSRGLKTTISDRMKP
jgi:hypothetical protein